MAAKRVEVTSAKVARIAGKVLRCFRDIPDDAVICAFAKTEHGIRQVRLGNASEFKAAFGSALTQSADRKKK